MLDIFHKKSSFKFNKILLVSLIFILSCLFPQTRISVLDKHIRRKLMAKQLNDLFALVKNRWCNVHHFEKKIYFAILVDDRAILHKVAKKNYNKINHILLLFAMLNQHKEQEHGYKFYHLIVSASVVSNFDST